jgi:hypothetical protein
MRKSMDKFTGGMPRLSLGDIRGDGYGRAAHLRYQSKPFVGRKGARDLVHAFHQSNRLLPDDQILVPADLLLFTHDLRPLDSAEAILHAYVVTCHSSLVTCHRET